MKRNLDLFKTRVSRFYLVKYSADVNTNPKCPRSDDSLLIKMKYTNDDNF